MSDHPFVSIILPIRNECHYIKRTLNAVLAQDYPYDRMEILIADGTSTDGTREIIHQTVDKHNKKICENSGNSWQKNLPPNIQILNNPQKIVPTALNIALRQARGEIIIRVDGHTVIEPDYVRGCVEKLQQTGADNVGGKMNAVAETPIGWAIAIATSSPFGVGGARFHYSNEEEWGDTVYMGAWRREMFARVGPFDEELVRNQDDEYNYRIRKLGGKILLSPDIRSKYYSRASLRKLWHQYSQYGYWKVRVLQKHSRQMRPRQFVPPAFVASLLASVLLVIILTLLSIPYPLAFIPLFIILGVYLFANLAASLWTSSRRGWRYLFLLPLVYSILHISYGLGFLVGLLKFANRWGDKDGKVPSWEDVKIRTTSGS